MSEYNKYLENVYSDELITIDPDEFDEVYRLMAEEGYHEFSIELEHQLDEQQAWQGSKQYSDVLIKKACEHSQCGHFKCERGLRIGGIEI
ncbi:MAG TPA: hypothetical protein VJX74_12855 [Blastocatellia bacterium]|nr:hypothetical protein [Blastocatellia bacterium]